MKALLLAVALFVPTASYGADMAVKAPAVPPPALFSWTGFYVGGNIGGGWGNRDVSFAANDLSALSAIGPTIPGAGILPPPNTSFGVSGVVGGVQLGYNYQLNPNWLVGVETDFSGSDVKGSGLSSGVHAATVPFTLPVDEHIKWFGTVRGRVGYLPTPNLLAYVTGGFAYGSVDRTGSWSNNSPAFFILNAPAGAPGTLCAPSTVCWAGSSSNTLTGWTVGGGLEYALGQHWTIRAEYLYLNLDNKPLTQTQRPFTTLPAGGTPSSFNSNYNRTDLNDLRVGLNYRF